MGALFETGSGGAGGGGALTELERIGFLILCFDIINLFYLPARQVDEMDF